jgi:hypothetical protein
MSGPAIPSAVIADQHAASDPATSAWVSANAGSGKTHVLAQRVIRLLLEDTDPAKILCLTFTKAAAANMANRIFDTLGRWIELDDAALDAAIHKTGLNDIDPKRRAQARRLFASALETPGGLKVQTIHGFCTRLLQQFPFEANVAARFRVMEDTEQGRLLDDIRRAVLLEGAQQPDGPAGRTRRGLRCPRHSGSAPRTRSKRSRPPLSMGRTCRPRIGPRLQRFASRAQAAIRPRDAGWQTLWQGPERPVSTLILRCSSQAKTGYEKASSPHP